MVRLEMLGPLPSVLRPEDRAEVLHARVQRAGALRPAPFVGVEWIPEQVVVAVRLASQLGRVARVAMHRTESPRPVRVQVELGLAAGDELRQGPADAAGAAKSVQRQACRDVEPRRTGHGADQRVGVRRHRIGVADQLHDPGLAQEREAASRAVKKRLEAALIGWKRHARVIPRRPVQPARDRVAFVAAEHHPAGLGLAVDEVVRIAKARHVVRDFMAWNRAQRGVLVVDRGGDDDRACHGRDLRPPQTAGHNHHLGLDASRRRHDRLHRASIRPLDAGHARVGHHPRAHLARGPCQCVRRRVRVEVAVARNPHRAVQRVPCDDRHQPRRLVGRHQLHIEADAARPARASLQLHKLLLAGREAQAADGLEDAELAVQLDAVAAEPHHRRRRVELGDQARRVAGRAARELALVEQEGVLPAGFGKVIGDARAGDAAADHDRPGSLHRSRLSGMGAAEAGYESWG